MITKTAKGSDCRAEVAVIARKQKLDLEGRGVTAQLLVEWKNGFGGKQELRVFLAASTEMAYIGRKSWFGIFCRTFDRNTPCRIYTEGKYDQATWAAYDMSVCVCTYVRTGIAQQVSLTRCGRWRFAALSDTYVLCITDLGARYSIEKKPTEKPTENPTEIQF